MSSTGLEHARETCMGKTVMVIDDDLDILEALQMTLESEGYATIVTHDAEEVLPKARMYHPDLIILDLLLSGHDGQTIAQMLKRTEQTKAIPLLMISAHPDAQKRAETAGANAFLAKPFDIVHFLETVEALL